MRRYPKLSADFRLVHPTGTAEFFVYAPATGEQYELNEVAFRMITQMTGENDVDAIRRTTENDFTEAFEVADDLEQLIQDLLRAGCITIDER